MGVDGEGNQPTALPRPPELLKNENESNIPKY
jgi:hypothetical protein